MRTKFTILFAFFLAGTFYAKSQTAYAYYFINKNLGNKDVYIFTSPMAFSYPKGSSYVFAPPALEKSAQNVIEDKLKRYDPSFNGLYVNQVSNGSNTSLENLENTNREIRNKMAELYASLRNQSRSTDVAILLVDSRTGNTLSYYLLDATGGRSSNGGAGNGN